MICENVITYLKTQKRPVPQRELMNRVYLKYNEVLSLSVDYALKRAGVEIKNGTYSLKGD